MVYIRGSGDSGRWWDESPANKSLADHRATDVRKGGVLVNAHFDSVPSGYGATDDGVGVVTVLQLISYFTTPGNTPKRGVVALLNNGEEVHIQFPKDQAYSADDS
jgi:acetylornithine deacetylase/succinyl-diaminopimelate desuccinylase-like protein